jgi:hypothetical protein
MTITVRWVPARIMLAATGRRGNHRIRRAGSQNDEVKVGRRLAGGSEGMVGGDRSHIGNLDMRDSSLLDPGSGGDPII